MPAVITNEMVFAALPPRPPESHKGAYGRVLAVCGCPAYRGAAALSVLGALRAGAGVVTLAAGESVIQSIAARVLEATFLPLPDESALASMAETATVCLAGCGREADETTAREMKLLLERTRGTVVLDAGGLCSLAAEKQAMRPAAGRLIVTPHPGEMARLCGKTVERVQADRVGTAVDSARRYGVILVLKGAETVITDGEQVCMNRTGNQGMAMAG